MRGYAKAINIEARAMIDIASKHIIPAVMRYARNLAETANEIKEAGADEAVLTLKSLEAFAKAADGKATKIIIPSDLQGIAGLTKTIAEVARPDVTEKVD